jgi:hypothetical protein
MISANAILDTADYNSLTIKTETMIDDDQPVSTHYIAARCSEILFSLMVRAERIYCLRNAKTLEEAEQEEKHLFTNQKVLLDQIDELYGYAQDNIGADVEMYRPFSIKEIKRQQKEALDKFLDLLDDDE